MDNDCEGYTPIRELKKWTEDMNEWIARENIFSDVVQERKRQNELHGAQRDVPAVREDTTYGISELASRAAYARAARTGKMSHVLIILEELAEVIHAATPEEMDKELVQLIASCVKALEAHRHQMRTK